MSHRFNSAKSPFLMWGRLAGQNEVSHGYFAQSAREPDGPQESLITTNTLIARAARAAMLRIPISNTISAVVVIISEGSRISLPCRDTIPQDF